MGLSYSMLASALWPLIAMVIPEHQMGTAYGMQVFCGLYCCTYASLLSLSCLFIKEIKVGVVK